MGPIVRQAAGRRPERIAGLVLVDPTDEAADVLFGRAFRTGERVVLRLSAVLARLGLLKALFRGLLRGIPDDVRRDLEREAFTVGTVRTQREQARTFLGELALWRQDPPGLGDIPVTVVSGGLGGSGFSAGMRARANAAHAHRVTLSPMRQARRRRAVRPLRPADRTRRDRPRNRQDDASARLSSS